MNLGFLNDMRPNQNTKTCTMTSQGVCRIFVITSLKCIRFETHEIDCLKSYGARQARDRLKHAIV